MKTTRIYVLKDTITEDFSLPMTYPNDRAFKRALKELFEKRPQSRDCMVAYCIGSIDIPQCDDDLLKLSAVEVGLDD